MTTEEKKIEGHSPYVEFAAQYDGTVTAVLTFYREKRNGQSEDFRVTFRYLDAESVACIGRGARRVIYHVKNQVVERMDRAYKLVITPGS